ncbi:MAG: HlyD family secretion protein [Thermodesulfobacteriota bacterium]
MNNLIKTSLLVSLLLILAIIIAVTWWFYIREKPLDGIASGNGRIEATEIDIATKYQGRVEKMYVAEGEIVSVNQTVALMDTRSLNAQLAQAEAKILQANKEKINAEFIVAQRRSEYDLARKNLIRADTLWKKGIIAEQEYDIRFASMNTAKDALAASKAQISEIEALIKAAEAQADRIQSDLEDAVLKTPIRGRVIYRLAEPGEVLPAGGKVLTLIKLTDVYMTIFLPETQVGRVALGDEARIILDAVPQYVIPGNVSFVAANAQFTPKEVETRTEREKLMFRVKIRIPLELLKKYESRVKTGLPGIAYVRLSSKAEWPENLHVKLPQ